MDRQEKDKKEKIILVVVGILFAVFLIRFVLINFAGKKGIVGPNEFLKRKAGVADTDRQGPVAQVLGALPQAEQVVVEDDSEAVLKNPFDVPVELFNRMKPALTSDVTEGNEAGEDIPSINIQGIAWGGDSPFIFINDKIYRKGDMVSDAQILDIDKKGAYFLYNGRRVLVKLKNKI